MSDDPRDWPYTDNDDRTMADKLVAEAADGATRLDVATGYLAVSAWGAVGKAVEALDRFRLLLGKDYELVRRTKGRDESDVAALVAQALRDDSQPPRLVSREDAAVVERFVAFLERDTSEVRAWRGEGFLHAKAYLFDQSAGVGSANFTANGLLHNRELVMWRQDREKLKELDRWFDGYWDHPDSHDYKAELIEVLRGTAFGGEEYSPYDVLIRTLAERYGLEEPPSLQGATFQLKWFQEDALARLVKLLSTPARGALLADAVGLGKTFIALGVMHHFLHEKRESVKGQPVTLVIPASLRPTWERELDRYQLRWAVEIENIQRLKSEANVERLAGADLVIIDEAHRLRGRGTWFTKVMELLHAAGDPRVLLLTATPVNTGIDDLTTLLKVITKNRRNVWAPEIPDFERYLKRVERNLVDPYPVLDRAVVRRSRTDILTAYEERRAAGQHVEALKLPERRLAHADYRYITDGSAVAVFDTFARLIPDLRLAPYDLERFRRSNGEAGDQAPASSLAGLYLAGLLKRFESSLRAVRISLRRLDRVLDRYGAALAETPPRVLSLEQQPALRLVDSEVREDDDGGGDLDESWAAALSELPPLTEASQYDLAAVRQSLEADRQIVSQLLAVLPPEDDDGKVAALIDLLRRRIRGSSIGLGGDRRVLVFTQFRDTAIYLAERLGDAGVGPVALLHGGSDTKRRMDVARTFDPDAAGELEAATAGEVVPRILVATDVLAEGHNLQLASAVVNFDLHWNPQVAVQRSGRPAELAARLGVPRVLPARRRARAAPRLGQPAQRAVCSLQASRARR